MNVTIKIITANSLFWAIKETSRTLMFVPQNKNQCKKALLPSDYTQCFSMHAFCVAGYFLAKVLRSFSFNIVSDINHSAVLFLINFLAFTKPNTELQVNLYRIEIQRGLLRQFFQHVPIFLFVFYFDEGFVAVLKLVVTSRCENVPRNVFFVFTLSIISLHYCEIEKNVDFLFTTIMCPWVSNMHHLKDKM